MEASFLCRMLSFERILRAASGNPNLALLLELTDDTHLPDPDRRQLPLAFRQPADASNPLFVSQRAGPMNDGTGYLPPADVDYSQAFTYTNFGAPGSVPRALAGRRDRTTQTATTTLGHWNQGPTTFCTVIGGWMRPTHSAQIHFLFAPCQHRPAPWKRLARRGDRQDQLATGMNSDIHFLTKRSAGEPISK